MRIMNHHWLIYHPPFISVNVKIQYFFVFRHPTHLARDPASYSIREHCDLGGAVKRRIRCYGQLARSSNPPFRGTAIVHIKAKFHYAILVADRVCDQDSVMEFGLDQLRTG